MRERSGGCQPEGLKVTRGALRSGTRQPQSRRCFVFRCRLPDVQEPGDCPTRPLVLAWCSWVPPARRALTGSCSAASGLLPRTRGQAPSWRPRPRWSARRARRRRVRRGPAGCHARTPGQPPGRAPIAQSGRIRAECVTRSARLAGDVRCSGARLIDEVTLMGFSAAPSRSSLPPRSSPSGVCFSRSPAESSVR